MALEYRSCVCCREKERFCAPPAVTSDSPHGHVTAVYNHRSEACRGLSVRAAPGLAGTGAAASGHQLGAVWYAAVAVVASVAGLYQLLQDVVGLGVVVQALQHPPNVIGRVS